MLGIKLIIGFSPGRSLNWCKSHRNLGVGSFDFKAIKSSILIQLFIEMPFLLKVTGGPV